MLNSSSRFRTNHNNMQQALHMYTLICHRGKSDAQPWRHTGPRRPIYKFFRHATPPGERREQQAGPSWQHRAQARSSAIARCSVEGRARGNWPVSQSVISRSLPESPTRGTGGPRALSLKLATCAGSRSRGSPRAHKYLVLAPGAATSAIIREPGRPTSPKGQDAQPLNGSAGLTLFCSYGA